MNQPQAIGNRYMGIQMNSGITALNTSAYFWACLIGIMMSTFIPQLQPYLLTHTLQIPQEQQGVISGNLSFWGEIALILTVGVWGSITDKYGRRIVTTCTYLIMAIACFLYPRAETYEQMIFARIVFGIGAAAYGCFVITIIADYATPQSRGKMTGIHALFNGLGALVTVFLWLRMPARLEAQGMSPLDAALTTYNIVSVICIVSALLMWFGINKNWPRQTGPQDSMLTIAKAGFVSAKNPKIALAYAAAFVSRGNLAIVGTFFTLWLANYGTAELGMTRADALKQAAISLAIVNISVLIGAPLIGILADRINRVTALVITLLIAAIGYGGTYFIDNPFGPGMKMLAIIIGLGEVGCIIGSSTLIAQESPVRIRGAVVGFFSACGAIGILIASKVGGQLFDSWSPTAPFVLFGLFALIVALCGIALRLWGNPEPDQGDELAHTGV